MVMPVLPHEKTFAASGPATEEGRRPTIVAGPVAASPELLTLPRRRMFKVRDKLRILAEVDAARGTPGGVGAAMRREGLYSSALSDWRGQRDAGALNALSPVARGPKIAPADPLAAERARLLRDNARLTQRLERAEAIIDLQKSFSLAGPVARQPASPPAPCALRHRRARRNQDARSTPMNAKPFWTCCANRASSISRLSKPMPASSMKAFTYVPFEPCTGFCTRMTKYARGGDSCAIPSIKSRNFWLRPPTRSGPGTLAN